MSRFPYASRAVFLTFLRLAEGLLGHLGPLELTSLQPCDHINFDVELLGDCDIVVAELCRRAGWPLEHEMIPSGQEVHVATDEELPFRHMVKVVTASGS